MGKYAMMALLAASAAGCSDPATKEVLTFGTGPDALGFGEPCIPMFEDSPQFAGFVAGGAELTWLDPQCSSGACLVDNFQGRVTCPDGNLGAGECFTPAGELVTVDVRPQPLGTRAEDHVYCSCRCDGPRALAPFCECPRGTTCEPLFPYSVSEPVDPTSAAGSYCVKE
jgi:hypothetical protein